MAHQVSMLSATILILINIVFVSSAPYTFDTISNKDGAVVTLTAKDVIPNENKAELLHKHAEAASDTDHPIKYTCSMDTYLTAYFEIENKGSKVVDFPVEINVEDTTHLHFSSVLNEPLSNAVVSVAEGSEPVDSSTVNLNVRLNPLSTAKFEVLIAAH